MQMLPVFDMLINKYTIYSIFRKDKTLYIVLSNA